MKTPYLTLESDEETLESRQLQGSNITFTLDIFWIAVIIGLITIPPVVGKMMEGRRRS